MNHENRLIDTKWITLVLGLRSYIVGQTDRQAVRQTFDQNCAITSFSRLFSSRPFTCLLCWERKTPWWGGSLGRWGWASTSAVWDCHLKTGKPGEEGSQANHRKKETNSWKLKEWQKCLKIVPHHSPPPAPAPALSIQNTDLAFQDLQDLRLQGIQLLQRFQDLKVSK